MTDGTSISSCQEIVAENEVVTAAMEAMKTNTNNSSANNNDATAATPLEEEEGEGKKENDTVKSISRSDKDEEKKEEETSYKVTVEKDEEKIKDNHPVINSSVGIISDAEEENKDGRNEEESGGGEKQKVHVEVNNHQAATDVASFRMQEEKDDEEDSSSKSSSGSNSNTNDEEEDVEKCTDVTPMEVASSSTTSNGSSMGSDSERGGSCGGFCYDCSPDQLLAYELNQLTFNERNNINEEIHGIRDPYPQEETKELVLQSLMELEIEIDKIPNKPAYDLAQKKYEENKKKKRQQQQQQQSNKKDKKKKGKKCNSKEKGTKVGYVNSDDFRLIFLRCELFDAKKAAIRLCNYLDLLVEVWGDSFALEREINMNDFDRVGLKILKGGYYQNLPGRDRAGRRITGAFTGDFQFVNDRPNAHDRIRTTLYMVMQLVNSDVDTQRKGAAFMFWAHNISINDFNTRKIVYSKSFHLLPIRISALHVCLPDSIINGSGSNSSVKAVSDEFRSTLMINMGKEMRSRLRIHHGSAVDCLHTLQTFGIQSYQMPINTNTGKMKTVNHNKYIDLHHVREKILKQHSINHFDTSSILKNVDEANNSKVDDEEKKEQHDDEKEEDDDEEEEAEEEQKEFLGIECPQPTDVLFGRGWVIGNHPGNALYRNLMDQVLDSYDNAKTRREKTCIAYGVVFELKTKYDTRFLKEDKMTGWWVEVSDDDARRKVSIGFRDIRKVRILSRQRQQKLQQQNNSDNPSPSSAALPPAPLTCRSVADHQNNLPPPPPPGKVNNNSNNDDVPVPDFLASSFDPNRVFTTDTNTAAAAHPAEEDPVSSVIMDVDCNDVSHRTASEVSIKTSSSSTATACTASNTANGNNGNNHNNESFRLGWKNYNNDAVPDHPTTNTDVIVGSGGGTTASRFKIAAAMAAGTANEAAAAAAAAAPDLHHHAMLNPIVEYNNIGRNDTGKTARKYTPAASPLLPPPIIAKPPPLPTTISTTTSRFKKAAVAAADAANHPNEHSHSRRNNRTVSERSTIVSSTSPGNSSNLISNRIINGYETATISGGGGSGSNSRSIEEKKDNYDNYDGGDREESTTKSQTNNNNTNTFNQFSQIYEQHYEMNRGNASSNDGNKNNKGYRCPRDEVAAAVEEAYKPKKNNNCNSDGNLNIEDRTCRQYDVADLDTTHVGKKQRFHHRSDLLLTSDYSDCDADDDDMVNFRW